MPAGVKDVDHGYRKLVALLRKLDKKQIAVKTGIRAEKGSRIFKATPDPNPEKGTRRAVPAGEGLTVVEIAIVNEFGTDDGRIPSRPAFRKTFDDNREKYYGRLAKGIGKVLDAKTKEGEAILEEVLGKLGAELTGDIQEGIRHGGWLPNADSTKRRKGSEQPLIDTGQERQSVDWGIEATVWKGKR